MTGATEPEIGQPEGSIRFGDSKGGGSTALLRRGCVDGVGRGVSLDALDGVLINVGEGEGVVGNIFIGADVTAGNRDICGREIVELEFVRTLLCDLR